ncbi:glycosyltransferase [Ruminococcus sp.]|uniref:glycosyltransferase n=1 Tax=Ruminococcus sp. TaxID=41978 RepID=UPI003869AF47
MKNKVVHLCLANFYTDGYSYQENMLPKFHQKLGYETAIIASLDTFNKAGQFVQYSGDLVYRNEYDIPVRRLPYRSPEKLYRILRRYQGVREALEQAKPDMLFIHGCQFSDIDIVADYLKAHPDVKVYVDNHADFNNSATNYLSKNILHRRIWKRCAHVIEPYTSKFYGVVPARVDFLEEMYGLPAHKCDLLVMGADDDAVEKALRPEVRAKRRRAYGVSDDDIVIVTGGKIDHNKPQVLTLMCVVNSLSDSRVKLIVFGSVADDLKAEFDSSLTDKVIHIGWRKSEDIYEDFAAADLVAFPGLHSVLWEQSVGMGVPGVFKRIEGFEHIDLGGNCLFFEKDDAQEYTTRILAALNTLDEMKTVAVAKGMKTFSYREIAKRALEG